MTETNKLEIKHADAALFICKKDDVIHVDGSWHGNLTSIILTPKEAVIIGRLLVNLGRKMTEEKE